MIPVGIDLGQRRIAWLSVGLAAANVYVFFRLALRPDYESIVVYWGFVPRYECLATLFSHMFLHGDLLHLLGNMIFFILPAMKVEDAIGTIRFGALYLSCGVAANAVHVLIEGDLPYPMIGASGAIAGTVAAFMVLYPTSRIRFWIFPPFPFFINLRAWLFLGYWFSSELFTGYRLVRDNVFSPVAVWAHVGGFAYGALTIGAFYGWKRGAILEMRSRRLSLWSKRVKRATKAESFRRTLGSALQGLVGLYILKVFLSGGVENLSRPSNPSQLEQALAKGIASTQSLESLVDEALGLGSPHGPYGSEPRDQLREYINSYFLPRARDHRRLRRGQLAPPPGTIGSLPRFLSEEYPNLPDKCRIVLEEVSAVSVLYSPGAMYEIFCVTALNPLEAFRAYLKKLNEMGWAVDSPIFDRETGAGLLRGTDGEWELSITIKPDPLAAPAPVMILWRMEKF